MEIQPDAHVTLEYELLDEEGVVVDSSEDGDLLEFVVGAEEVPPGLEQALIGKSVGDELRVELAAGEAFGDFSPDGIVTLPRDELPGDIELVPGEFLPLAVEHDDGSVDEMELRIVEVKPDALILDANHPLAGKPVTFVVKVCSVTAED